MRLDKYLKVSRIIKRRTVAKDVCDGDKVSLNHRLVKPSAQVNPGDIITLAHTSGAASEPFKNENDFNHFAEKMKTGQSVLFLVRRDGATFYVGFTN